MRNTKMKFLSSIIVFFGLLFGQANAFAVQPYAQFSLNGTIDPSAVAISAQKNTIYEKKNAPVGIFLKTDNGLTTNWLPITSAGGSTPSGVVGEVAYYDVSTGLLTS